MQRITGEKSKSSIFKQDGYLYEKDKEAGNGTIYLRCYNKKNGCTARAILRPGHNLLEVNLDNHTHARQLESIQKMEFKSALRSRAATQSFHRGNRAIFDEERMNHNIGDIAYPSCRSTMHRAMKLNMPNAANNYADVVEALNTDPAAEQFRYDTSVPNRNVFFKAALPVWNTLVFVSWFMVENYVANMRSIFVDGTFKVPRMFKQLVTIHFEGGPPRHYVFPFVYALMARKTAGAYNELLDYLCREYPAFQPSNIMTDFEAGLQRSLHEHFPLARLRGCWFHFAQAIYRRVSVNPLSRLYDIVGDMDRDNARDLIKMMMVLPLLPAGRIQEGMDVIMDGIVGLIQDPRLNAVDLNAMNTLGNYVQNYWINIVTPAVFSVHGQRRRTNNDVESFHSHLNRILHANFPSIWLYLGHLKEIEHRERVDFRVAQQGRAIRTGFNASNKRNNTRIRTLTEQLDNNILDVRQFLSQAKYLMNPGPLIQNDEVEPELEDLPDINWVPPVAVAPPPPPARPAAPPARPAAPPARPAAPPAGLAAPPPPPPPAGLAPPPAGPAPPPPPPAGPAPPPPAGPAPPPPPAGPAPTPPPPAGPAPPQPPRPAAPAPPLRIRIVGEENQQQDIQHQVVRYRIIRVEGELRLEPIN